MPENSGEPRTFTQDEVNALLASEKKRFKEKYADYEKVKEKAGKYDAAATRIGELEAEVSTSSLNTIRERIARQHNLSDTDVDLFLKGDNEEVLTAQAERIASLKTLTESQVNTTLGKTPINTGGDSDRDFFAQLFGETP